MAVLIAALTLGLILSFLALGVLISFRMFNFADLTTEGSFPMGGAIAASLIVAQINPVLSTLAAFILGFLSGIITGIIYTRFKIDKLLSGILVMTGLYSINLHIMGRSNIPLQENITIFTYIENLLGKIFTFPQTVVISKWTVTVTEIITLFFMLFIIIVTCLIIYLFFRTNLGTAMRAAGNNQQMVKALGGNTTRMIILGLSLSNGLIAVSGALFAQYQGFADVQMGIGMFIWGVASLMIGENLIHVKTLGLIITATIMGSILFRLLVAIALKWGVNPNDIKLITAVFVLIALVLPGLIRNLKNRKGIIINA